MFCGNCGKNLGDLTSCEVCGWQVENKKVSNLLNGKDSAFNKFSKDGISFLYPKSYKISYKNIILGEINTILNINILKNTECLYIKCSNIEDILDSIDVNINKKNELDENNDLDEYIEYEDVEIVKINNTSMTPEYFINSFIGEQKELYKKNKKNILINFLLLFAKFNISDIYHTKINNKNYTCFDILRKSIGQKEVYTILSLLYNNNLYLIKKSSDKKNLSYIFNEILNSMNIE